MANQFSQTGVLNVDSLVLLLSKEIDVMWMRENSFPGILAQFFDVDKKDSGLTHTIADVGSELPTVPLNNDEDDLPRQMPAPGFSKTFTLVQKRSGVYVTRLLVESQRFSMVEQMVGGQLKATMQTDEYDRAALFNNAFTSGTGSDSQYLCADSHPHENPDAGTWDNKGTGALSGPNLHALLLLGRKITNAQGHPDPTVVRTILGPEDLQQKLMELTGKGAGKPETAVNEENVLLPGLKVVISEYLSSATAYFGFGDRQGYNKGLHEVVLSPWTLMDNHPANVDIVIDKRVRSVKKFGFTRSKNVIGSAGT